MGIIQKDVFFLRNKGEAEIFGEFCARDHRLEAILERCLDQAEFMVNHKLEPGARAEHINDMLNFGEALLRCTEVRKEG